MRLSWFGIPVLVLISCSPFADRYAKVECVCPPGVAPTHRVFLQAPTGNSGCSPHIVGFYKEVAWLSIQLPDKPPSQVKYQASQVVVINETRSIPVLISGGFVEINQTDWQVTVSLQTPTGPFWANGVYPAR